MARFKKCAKVAHAKLQTFFPQISYCQTQQLLAAALGHKTYASFLHSDASAFDELAAYAVVVPEAAMLRALDFGIEMTCEHWDLLVDEISEEQVVGDLEICRNLTNIYWRSRNEFFDGQYKEIDDLVRHYGTVQVFRQLISERVYRVPDYVDNGGTLPQNIFVTLHGEILVGSGSSHSAGWGVPVHTEFGFEQVGRRLLAQCELTAVKLVGSPRKCCPLDELDSSGGMTFD